MVSSLMSYLSTISPAGPGDRRWLGRGLHGVPGTAAWCWTSWLAQAMLSLKLFQHFRLSSETGKCNFGFAKIFQWPGLLWGLATIPRHGFPFSVSCQAGCPPGEVHAKMGTLPLACLSWGSLLCSTADIWSVNLGRFREGVYFCLCFCSFLCKGCFTSIDIVVISKTNCDLILCTLCRYR